MSTSLNNTVNLAESITNPQGGEFSGTNVSNNIFNPQGLQQQSYTITYTYENPITTCSNSCTFEIYVNYPHIATINDDDITATSVCLGNSEDIAIAGLADEITITDSDGFDHDVTLTWTITGYDENTTGTYNAIATFNLLEFVIQSDPETTLQAGTTITVLSLPVVDCPIDFSITVNDGSLGLNASPTGGIFEGDGITGSNFLPTGLQEGPHTMTYSYSDINGCTNSCNFIITVTYPAITEIDVDNIIAGIDACAGTSKSDITAELPDKIKIKDADNIIHDVTLSWTINDYDENTTGTYVAVGTFDLPEFVIQSSPETALQVQTTVTVIETPVVSCPNDENITPKGFVL